MSFESIERIIQWLGGLLAYATLVEEFGEEWMEYCKRVPAFFPGWMRGLLEKSEAL